MDETAPRVGAVYVKLKFYIMKTKHTKGEWKVDYLVPYFPYSVMAKGKEICNFVDTSADFDERDSNAKLIASAPELLEAAMGLIQHSIPSSVIQHILFKKLKEAIKKATS